MLGWIEKVVPQPPASSPIRMVTEKGGKAGQTAREARPGLARQLPEGTSRHPAEGPGQEEAAGTHEPVSTTDSAGQGVLTWLSQGLGKVMPQPAQNAVPLQEVGKSFEASIEIPDVTEVQIIEDEEEELEITVLELDEAEEEPGELQSSSDNNALDKIGGKKVFTWLKEGFEKMIPQPENMKKAEERSPEKQAAGEGDFPASPPSAVGAKHRVSTASLSGLSVSLFPRTLGGDGSSVFTWLVQGLEKVIPQPVSPAKPDGQCMEAAALAPGQGRSKGA